MPVRPQHVLRGVGRRDQRLHRWAQPIPPPPNSCFACRATVVTSLSPGIVIGNIKNCWPGCNCRGVCSKADNFEINCTKKTAFTPVDKVRSRHLLLQYRPAFQHIQQTHFFVHITHPLTRTPGPSPWHRHSLRFHVSPSPPPLNLKIYYASACAAVTAAPRFFEMREDEDGGAGMLGAILD